MEPLFSATLALAVRGSYHSARSHPQSSTWFTKDSHSCCAGGSGPEGGGGEEDLWTTWGKIINEWDTQGNRKLPQIKVRLSIYDALSTVLSKMVKEEDRTSGVDRQYRML